MAPVRGGRPPHVGILVLFSIKNYHKPSNTRGVMAKNTFFIRASVNGGNAGSFAQTEIDLGSYTNLGSSKPEVLRIHNIIGAMTDSAGLSPTITGDTASDFLWQLTTQTQTAGVLMTDDSFVSGGRGAVRNPDSTNHSGSQAFESQILPQDFENGYVVAVPSLFLGGIGGTNFTEDVIFSVMLECTTEPMSKANAVSLAISQQ